MATKTIDSFLRQLCAPLVCRAQAGLADGVLLERFNASRDEASFEVLVRRHGPMVFGVCQRVLRNRTDSEDAFQATFLVFVRKAATIRPPGMVGSWLYGVAHNIAIRAKALNQRRRAKDGELARLAKSGECVESELELRGSLERQLRLLPEKYRSPIVLCDLEGISIKDAARQLGCPMGTVGTRLARGRRMLARRLARGGITLSAGAIATALSEQVATAGVPLGLLASTNEAAIHYACGFGRCGAAANAKVIALAEGVMKTMMITKFKIVSAIVFGLAAVVSASGGIVQTVAASKPTLKNYEAALAPAPNHSEIGEAKVFVKVDFPVIAVAWSPDGKTLATITRGKESTAVTLWDAQTGEEKRALNDEDAKALAFAPDGKSLATAGQQSSLGTVKMWDAATGRLKYTIGGHNLQTNSIAFSPDGQTLVSGSADKTLKFWDAGSGKALLSIDEHGYWVWSAAFSPDGKTVVLGGNPPGGAKGFDLTIWNAETGKLEKTFSLDEEEAAFSAAFSPNGKLIATGGVSQAVRLWDVETGKLKATLKGHDGSVLSVAFSSDGKLLASAGGDDKTVRIWDAGTGKLNATLRDNKGPVRSIAFSPDGKVLASGSDDGTVRIWKVGN
jgi:RNA polymerase sigma factor (sigma-70 family)